MPLTDATLSGANRCQRQAWAQIRHKPAVKQAMQVLGKTVAEFADILAVASERSRGLDQCHQRCVQLQQALALFSGEAGGISEELKGPRL